MSDEPMLHEIIAKAADDIRERLDNPAERAAYSSPAQMEAFDKLEPGIRSMTAWMHDIGLQLSERLPVKRTPNAINRE